MKKLPIYLLMGLIMGGVSIESASLSQSNKHAYLASDNDLEEEDEEDDYYEIMHRDQIDNTDTLAIPFDDSEVEDEEEIDHAEEKEVFSLPHSHSR